MCTDRSFPLIMFCTFIRSLDFANARPYCTLIDGSLAVHAEFFTQSSLAYLRFT